MMMKCLYVTYWSITPFLLPIYVILTASSSPASASVTTANIQNRGIYSGENGPLCEIAKFVIAVFTSVYQSLFSTLYTMRVFLTTSNIKEEEYNDIRWVYHIQKWMEPKLSHPLQCLILPLIVIGIGLQLISRWLFSMIMSVNNLAREFTDKKMPSV